MTEDVIDRLAGLPADSPLHAIRAQRPQARDNAQASYLALFRPEHPGDMTLAERHALAAFVAGVHGEADIAVFYATGFGEAALVATEAARAATRGPYGRFPAGPLSAEDAEGPTFQAAPEFGRKLAAGLQHAHALVFHPRDVGAADLQKLLDAGWSTTGIVTLSQLVAFLSFQIRVIAGLRALGATRAEAA